MRHLLRQALPDDLPAERRLLSTAKLPLDGLDQMRRAGVRHAYGLTTTIPDWLQRLGWMEVPKADLPAALNTSMELRGACPGTARIFLLDLA